MKSEPKYIRDFGYLNGYDETPEEVEKCKHPKKGREIGNCTYEYTCDICNITYKIDSSG